MIATWTGRFAASVSVCAADAAVAAKVLAAGHPDRGFPLAEDDRVEEAAVARLDADRATAALFEVVEPHPGLDRLGFELARQRGRDRVAGLAVEAQTLRRQGRRLPAASTLSDPIRVVEPAVEVPRRTAASEPARGALLAPGQDPRPRRRFDGRDPRQ